MRPNCSTPLKRSVLVATVAIAIVVALFAVSNHYRLAAARDVMERTGPSEYSLEISYGPNSRCDGLASVGFWQHGPGIPERQGYICGGVLTSPRMELVPFDEGLVPGFPDV